MKKQRFNGPMGHWMLQHLALRRSMGYIYRGAEYGLDAFDQFLREYFPDCKTITRLMVTEYLDSTRHLQPLSRQGHVSIVRQFCRFMFQYDTKTYIPEKGLIGAGKVQVKPHIYTVEEITQVMQQAMKLTVKANKILAETYVVIIGLLWVTGMRIGEVVRLKVQDIDVSRGILYVRQTKFYKSRAIPLLPSSTRRLLEYLALRAKLGYANESNAPLFINSRGKPCTISTTPKTLKVLIRRAGLITREGTIPRVHDVRHSFATRWLMDIYRSGRDPNIYLPVLATYMGHANIANTQVYLHPTVELLATAGETLRSRIHAKRGEA